MNISVLGKSGPSVVTVGLVCACAADSLTATASTAQNPLIIPGISILPDVFLHLARRAALSRLKRPAGGLCTGRGNGLFTDAGLSVRVQKPWNQRTSEP